MKMSAFLAGIGLNILSSCTDLPDAILPDDSPVLLTGRTCEAMHSLALSTSPTQPDAIPTPSGSPQSASESSLQLPDGSRILASATGGLRLDREELTYHNQRWEASHPLQWESSTGNTTFTAFHPTYADQRYTTDNLYAHGTLEDVLYLHADFPSGKPIQLKFKHLFAQLNLRLAPQLQANLQKLEITCPHTVSEIDLTQGTFRISEQRSHTDILLPHEGPTPYSVILPSGQSLSLTLRIYSDGKTYTSTLTTPELQSGQAYTYTLTEEATPGIATVDDWIAFRTLLYDWTRKEYKGKRLKDFGKTVNGVTTYYLLNDLDFSEVSANQNLSISSCTETEPQQVGFNDIFDGQGHTLSHLTVQPWQGTLGVFTGVNPSGCIQNLQLKNCTSYVGKNGRSINEGAGILAGYNYGIIRNCSVNDSQLDTYMNKSTSHTGSLAGICNGSVINCSAQNVTIHCTFHQIVSHSTGGIVGLLREGLILNCYASNIKLDNKAAPNGGICGEAIKGTILNCYSHQLQTNSKSGLLVGLAQAGSNLQNNFTETTTSKTPDIKQHSSKENNLINNKHYNANFLVKKTPLYKLLNQWINNEGHQKYPEHTFSQWKNDKQLPAQFIDR